MSDKMEANGQFSPQDCGVLLGGLCVYSALTTDPAVAALRTLLRAGMDVSGADEANAVEAYARLVQALNQSGKTLYRHLRDLVLYDDNPYSRSSARGEEVSPVMEAAARFDLSVLYRVATLRPSDVTACCGRFAACLPHLSQEEAPDVDWSVDPTWFTEAYRRDGVGEFARLHAFVYDGATLRGVERPDPIRLSDLKSYQAVRNKVIENTLAFVQGKPANNVLLYGDRGTGKSSTVKALLNEYAPQGLRMIQVGKEHITALPSLIERVQEMPMKFIIFIDDLTFNENDDSFGILKAVLEGSLISRPDNLLIYATSNRRHLIKETFSARDGDEVHKADTIDDNLSLSDRFGLTVTFTLPNRDLFLQIVDDIAQDRGLAIDRDTLNLHAERFALQKGARTPRLAKQFVDYAQARVELGLPL